MSQQEILTTVQPVEERALALARNFGVQPKEVVSDVVSQYLNPLSAFVFDNVIPAGHDDLSADEKMALADMRLPQSCNLEDYVSSHKGKAHWAALKAVKKHLTALRVETKKKGAAARSDANALTKAVIAVEGDSIGAIKPIEDIVASDASALKEADDERKRKVRERTAKIEEAISFYTNFFVNYFNANAEKLGAGISDLSSDYHSNESIKNHFSQWDTDKIKGQGAEKAIEERDKALISLNQALETAKASESAAAELAKMKQLQDISTRFAAGLAGGSGVVDSAMTGLSALIAAENDPDVTSAINDALKQLRSRKLALVDEYQEKQKQEAEKQKLVDAEKAKLTAEKAAADAAALAAQQENERLKQVEVNRLQAEAAAKAAQEAEAAKLAEEAKEVERQAALAPDKEKLQSYIASIRDFADANRPSLDAADASDLDGWLSSQLNKLLDAASLQADKL